MEVKKRIACLFLALTPVFLFANTNHLSDFKAEVQAIRHGTIDIKAKGEIVFELTEAGLWTLQIDLNGGPLKTHERSIGEYVGENYLPLSYERSTKFLFVKEKVNWSFDWTRKLLNGKVQKKEYEHELKSIVHDPLSFQVELRKALISNEKSYDSLFLRWSRPEDIAFEIIGEELLSIGDGRVRTLILKQTKGVKDDERKLIWVSPEHEYVPLRYATYKDGKIKDEVKVKSLWVNDTKVTFN